MYANIMVCVCQTELKKLLTYLLYLLKFRYCDKMLSVVICRLSVVCYASVL